MIKVQIVWHLNHLCVPMYTTGVYYVLGLVECAEVSKTGHLKRLSL